MVIAPSFKLLLITELTQATNQLSDAEDTQLGAVILVVHHGIFTVWSQVAHKG